MSNSFVTPWTVACQVPLSVGFPRQEYWSGVPFPPSGDLPDPGIKPVVPALADRFFTTVPPRKLSCIGQCFINLVVCYNHRGSLLEVWIPGIYPERFLFFKRSQWKLRHCIFGKFPQVILLVLDCGPVFGNH